MRTFVEFQPLYRLMILTPDPGTEDRRQEKRSDCLEELEPFEGLGSLTSFESEQPHPDRHGCQHSHDAQPQYYTNQRLMHSL